MSSQYEEALQAGGSRVPPFSDYSEARFELRSTINEKDLPRFAPVQAEARKVDWLFLSATLRNSSEPDRRALMAELAAEPRLEIRGIGTEPEGTRYKSIYRALSELLRARHGRGLSTYVEFGIEGGLDAIAPDLLKQRGGAELESLKTALSLSSVQVNRF